MAVVLIGIGANDIKIVSMVFETMEKGLEYVTNILGEPTKKYDGSYIWQWIDEKLNEEIGKKIITSSYTGKVYEEPEIIAEKFFTSYYDGCGGCYGFELKEIEYGKPFVAFNLD